MSRQHAEIVYRNDQYYILDTNSKFGTLVSFTEDEVLNDGNKTLKIQFGRSLFDLEFREMVPPEVDTE